MFAGVSGGRRAFGTRFKLFPQPPFLAGFEEPETVVVSPPAGSVHSGPSDDRMYVVDPIGKVQAYGTSMGRFGNLYLPPWDGPVHRPAMPDAAGHFEHLEPGTPQFEAAHLYGTARFVLDIWEGYFERPIPWHFRRYYDRMELILLPTMNNATMGYGFMEVGGYTTRNGEFRSFALNFDVIAHEIGHSIIYNEVGVPSPEGEQGEYFGFHESAADLIALIAVMHFDSVLDDVLETTRGNLYALNKLNRIGELSEHEQIRAAANTLVLSDFSEGWTDEHQLAQPLTAAVFDIFVDIFHELLLDRGLISPELEDLSDQLEGLPEYELVMQSRFDEAYARDPGGFRETLIDARDYVGTYLADMLGLISPDFLGYDDVGAALSEVDREISGGRYLRIINLNFLWRDIGTAVVGPRLSSPSHSSHVNSVRTSVPVDYPCRRKLPYSERMRAARNGGVPGLR